MGLIPVVWLPPVQFGHGPILFHFQDQRGAVNLLLVWQDPACTAGVSEVQQGQQIVPHVHPTPTSQLAFLCVAGYAGCAALWHDLWLQGSDNFCSRLSADPMLAPSVGNSSTGSSVHPPQQNLPKSVCDVQGHWPCLPERYPDGDPPPGKSAVRQLPPPEALRARGRVCQHLPAAGVLLHCQ